MTHPTQPPSPAYGTAPTAAVSPFEYSPVADAPVSAAGDHPAAPYTQSPGAYGRYYAPIPTRTPTLGRVALLAGGIGLAGSLINGLIIAAVFRPELIDSSTGAGTFPVLASFGLANLLLLWFCFGLWALVQGIVAMVTKRGAGAGAGALALGLVGPWIGVVIASVTFIARLSSYTG